MTTNVQATKKRDILFLLCLLYLLLPNLLFLWGWARPVVSVPLSLLLLYCSCRIIPPPPGHEHAVSKWDHWVLAATLILAFVWLFLSGMTGHTKQLFDYIVRNPIYETLVRCDWPILNSAGEYFVYYFAFMLPPAAIAKICCITAENCMSWYWTLMLWCYLGIVLILLLIFRQFRRHVLTFFLLWITLNTPINLFKRLFDSLAFRIESCKGLEPGSISSCWPWRVDGFLGATSQIFNTFHHAIPIWIILLLLLPHKENDRETFPIYSCLLLASLGVIQSPLGSAGIFIVLCFILITRWKHGQFSWKQLSLSVPSITGVALVCCTLLYFLQSNGGEIRPAWHPMKNLPSGVEFHASHIWISYILGLLCTLPIPFLVWKKDELLSPPIAATLFIIVAFPLIVIGQGSNELIFKASAVIFLIWPIYFCKKWIQSKAKGKALLAVCIAVSSVLSWEILIPAVSSLGFDKTTIVHNRQDKWQGHLNHPRYFGYDQFWGKNSPPLFYGEAGASAQGLLYWLSVHNRSDSEPLPPLQHRPTGKRHLPLRDQED